MTNEPTGVEAMAVPDIREPGSLEVLQGVSPELGKRRRGWWVLGSLVALVGAGVATWLIMGQVAEEASNTSESAAPSYAEVVTTDLIETSEYDGTMGRLAGDEVSLRVEGTVTALPEAGTILEQGDVVAWVDNRPIVLLYGELPVWRAMAQDTEGPDVEQLETALTALGYNQDEAAMTVDDDFSSATASVVEDWQEAIGAEDDGVVGLGEVMFSPGPLRVGSLQVEVGDQVGAGAVIFTTSGDDVEVSFGLPTFEQGNVDVGDRVEVTLPDLSTATGVVSEIATVATLPDDGGQPSFETTVTLDDTSVADGIDDAPVTVAVITDQVEGVLAVPVEALLALTEGGYAVEVEDGGGTRLVAVEPGFYADGLVEITGELAPGDRVVVP